MTVRERLGGRTSGRDAARSTRRRSRDGRRRWRALAIFAVVGALVAPVVVVLAVPLLMGPMLGGGACPAPGKTAPGQTLPAPLPAQPEARGMAGAGVDAADELVVESTSGEPVPLEAEHLENAARLVESARGRGADDRAVTILLMTALQESKLRNLANPGAVPESLQYPHDGVGHDHDSVGVLQQRLSAGWGSVEQLMDPAYAAEAFLGGADGPNAGAPVGLYDIEGWERAGLGAAAQAVQVSAFPEAYDQWLRAALEVLDHVGKSGVPCRAPTASVDGAYPLAGPAPITDGVGPRPCRVGGAGGCASSTWHPALDFGAACGVPVLSARPGVVTVAGDYWVSVTTDDGTVVSYLHMYSSDVVVALGDTVDAGQQLGSVGSAGPSTGCHLDFRVNALGTTDTAVAALPHIGDASVAAGFVDPVAYMAMYGVDLLAGGA